MLLLSIVWTIVAICAYLAIADNGKYSFCHGSSRDSKVMLLADRNLACLAYGRAIQAKRQFVASARKANCYDVEKADRLLDAMFETRRQFLNLQYRCKWAGYITKNAKTQETL